MIRAILVYKLNERYANVHAHAMQSVSFPSAIKEQRLQPTKYLERCEAGCESPRQPTYREARKPARPASRLQSAERTLFRQTGVRWYVAGMRVGDLMGLIQVTDKGDSRLVE